MAGKMMRCARWAIDVRGSGGGRGDDSVKVVQAGGMSNAPSTRTQKTYGQRDILDLDIVVGPLVEELDSRFDSDFFGHWSRE